MQYFFIFFLIFATLSSCDSSSVKGAPSTSRLTSRSGIFKLNGPAAGRMMEALENSGVQDTDHLLGAKNIRAQTIVCQRAVGPRRIPSCSIILKNQEILNPDPKEAEVLYQTLLDAGGLFFTGEPDVIGVLADEVACTRPIIPQPETRCQFLINIRNSTHAQ